MRTSQRPTVKGHSTRRGQMSTASFVFLVIGLVVVAVSLMAFVSAVFLLPAVHQLHTTVKRNHSKSNLEEIGIAMHNFHDARGAFPSGVKGSKVGIPEQSWMTNLLPFVSQSNLFEALNPEKAWSAPENQDVFSNIVPGYLSPLANPAERLVGDLGAAHYAGNSHLLGPDKEFKISQIKDGTSNTILAGEVATGFKAWGDPSNVRDPAEGLGKSANQFGSSGETAVTLILLADGSVRTIAFDIEQQTLKSLATPNGKEDSVGDF